MLRARQTTLVTALRRRPTKPTPLPLADTDADANAGASSSTITRYSDKGRYVLDHLASRDECSRLARAVKAALLHEHSDGAERLLPAAGGYGVDERLGATAPLLAVLIERVHSAAATLGSLPPPPYSLAAALLSWHSALTPSAAAAAEQATSGPHAPHIDKANRESFDVSCVLYLSSQGVDFDGGAFCLHDTGADLTVAPRAGRLVAFGSGEENLHSVRPVLRGDRLALSCWFSVQPGQSA